MLAIQDSVPHIPSLKEHSIRNIRGLQKKWLVQMAYSNSSHEIANCTRMKVHYEKEAQFTQRGILLKSAILHP